MKLAEKLLRRLREETDLPLPDDAELIRTWPSRASRAEGAWAWTVWSEKHGFKCWAGSQFTMAECVRSASLMVDTDRFGDHHIYPLPEPGAHR